MLAYVGFFLYLFLQNPLSRKIFAKILAYIKKKQMFDVPSTCYPEREPFEATVARLCK